MMARDILYIEKTYIFIELATTVASQVTQINNLAKKFRKHALLCVVPITKILDSGAK